MLSRHDSSSPPEKTTCSTGQSARSGSQPPAAASEKPVALRITDGGCAFRMSASNAAASASLRLLTKTGKGRSPRAASASHQRIDRGGVAGLHQRPIEHERDDAALPAPLARDFGEARHRTPGPVQSGAQQRRRLGPGGLAADQTRRIAQKIVGVARPAFRQIAPQPLRHIGRHCREPGQFGIGPVVAGQQRQRDAVVAAGLGQTLDPVRPIGAAAEQPGDHQPRLRHGLHVQIDREIVPEPHHRREPQRRRLGILGTPPRLRRREQRDLGIGARQHDDVARRLCQIDRGRSVGDDAGFGGEQMHSAGPGQSRPARLRRRRGRDPSSR